MQTIYVHPGRLGLIQSFFGALASWHMTALAIPDLVRFVESDRPIVCEPFVILTASPYDVLRCILTELLVGRTPVLVEFSLGTEIMLTIPCLHNQILLADH